MVGVACKTEVGRMESPCGCSLLLLEHFYILPMTALQSLLTPNINHYLISVTEWKTVD